MPILFHPFVLLPAIRYKPDCNFLFFLNRTAHSSILPCNLSLKNCVTWSHELIFTCLGGMCSAFRIKSNNYNFGIKIIFLSWIQEHSSACNNEDHEKDWPLGEASCSSQVKLTLLYRIQSVTNRSKLETDNVCVKNFYQLKLPKYHNISGNLCLLRQC